MTGRISLTIALIALSLASSSCSSEPVDTTVTSLFDATTNIETGNATELGIDSTETVVYTTEGLEVPVTTETSDQVTIEPANVEATTYSDPESIAIELAPGEEGDSTKKDSEKTTNKTDSKVDLPSSMTILPVVAIDVPTITLGVAHADLKYKITLHDPIDETTSSTDSQTVLPSSTALPAVVAETTTETRQAESALDARESVKNTSSSDSPIVVSVSTATIPVVVAEAAGISPAVSIGQSPLTVSDPGQNTNSNDSHSDSTAVPIVEEEISTKISTETHSGTALDSVESEETTDATEFEKVSPSSTTAATVGTEVATKSPTLVQVAIALDDPSGKNTSQTDSPIIVSSTSTAIPIIVQEVTTKTPAVLEGQALLTVPEVDKNTNGNDSQTDDPNSTTIPTADAKETGKNPVVTIAEIVLGAIKPAENNIQSDSQMVIASPTIPTDDEDIINQAQAAVSGQQLSKSSQEEDEESSTETATTDEPDDDTDNSDDRVVLKTKIPDLNPLGTLNETLSITDILQAVPDLTTIDDKAPKSTDVPVEKLVTESTTEEITTEFATVRDSTESSLQLTVQDTTDAIADQVDDVVRMEPQVVRIFDPSVDVEATTFLAEANQQTEPSVTTESLLQQVDELAEELIERVREEEETLTTDDSLVTMTTQLATESGTESFTESGTELMSETTALPAIRRPSTETTLSTKKRNYKGYKVYRVILPTEESVQRILSMEDEPGVEFWADPRLLLRPRGLFVTSAADIMVAPKIVPQIEEVFREARLTYTVLIDDVQKSIRQENPSGSSFARSQSTSSKQHRLTWERYHRLADINSYLDYLKEAHSDWVEVVPIGKSSQGRPIQVIKLSRPRQQTDTTERGPRKAIFIDAGIHANEWITPAALTWMVNELVENADSYSCILDRFDWYFVPMVNPDGYEYSHAVDRMWRKTRRNYTSTLLRSSARKLRVDADRPGDEEQCVGADINRNFEFYWRKGGSSSNVCSPSFAGMKPFSEPEARALANFMLKQRSRIAMYISLHSYSQMWLLPWGFAETRPEDFSQLYSLAKIGARALQKVHNTSYLIGSVPDLLALASGTSQDWAKGVAGVRYSYTLEMRDAGQQGMILPAQQIIPTAEETWAGIYAAAIELAHRVYDQLPSCSTF